MIPPAESRRLVRWGQEVTIVRFGVLGPVSIVADSAIEVGGPQLRRLLAALVLHAGRVVSTDRLSTIVFGDTPSDTAATNLRSYIARLRRLLVDDGSGIEIVTAAPGYRLELGSSTIDAIDFEAALDEGRRRLRLGQHEEAIVQLEQALALWRGPAYSGFEDEDWAMAEAQRLEELRLESEELRGEALVAAGRHRDAVAGLTALVREQPLRGSAAATLMVALHRSDRQTEALRVAHEHRDALADAGLEPAPDINDLEQRIAAHDPSLHARPGIGPHHVRSYELLEELGSDDLGIVHRATQSGVGREVAVTHLPPEVADHPEYIRQFEGLVHRVAQLEHPNIVAILDVWREPGAAFLVTRLTRGGTLRNLLEKAPCALDRVVAVVEQASAALHTAHLAGFSHGVLGPDHIRFDEDGRLVVAGIGISAFVASLDGSPVPYRDGGPAKDQADLASLARSALIGSDGEQAPGASDGTTVSHSRPELLALDGVLARAGAVTPEDRYPDVDVFAHAFVTAAGTRGPDDRLLLGVPNPYKGLLAFGEGDAEDYHGREAVVDQLLARVVGSSSPTFVTVTGPSGSGKSSLVRAGLLPRLRSGPSDGHGSWFVTTMIPGRSPFTELNRALETVAVGPRSRLRDPAVDGIANAIRAAVPSGTPLLLVIDQLEELFTLAHTDDRRPFIDGLVDAMGDTTCDLRVVATLRADLYDRPLAEPEFGDLVAAGTFPLVGMRPADIERAVVVPAESRGVEIDGRVVAEIVAEVSHHDNALPLLQYCLTELFDRRSGTSITLADYEDLGGVAGAISEVAEDRYRRAARDDQHAIRQVMLRLVVAGEGRADLRRRTPRAELLELPGGRETIGRVLDLFGRARLLAFDHDPTTRQETVEVAHEALLRSWPRLQQWVRDAGRGLVVRDEVASAAKAWRDGGEDPSDLARGTRLVVAEDWAKEYRDQVGALDRRFLDASAEGRRAEEQYERDVADRQRRTNLRLRRALLAVAVLLAAASVAFALAIVQRERADDRTREAVAARAKTLAVTARESVMQDRSLALLLAVEASRLSDRPETRRALFDALAGGGERFTRTVIPTPASDYVALAVSDDGRLAAARRADGSVDIVDLEEGAVRFAGLPGKVRPAGGIALDPQGRWLATAGFAAPGVVVWDLGDGTVLTELHSSAPITEARFTPDGSALVVADEDDFAVYDVSRWTVDRRLDVPDTGKTVFGGRGEPVPDTVTAFDITEDNSRLVLATTAINRPLSLAGPVSVSVIDLADGEVLVGPTTVQTSVVDALDVVDELEVVVIGDEQIRLLDLTTLEPVTDPVGDSVVGYTDVAFGASGVLVGGSETDLHAFLDVDGEFEPIVLPVDAGAPGIAFLDDGSTMVTADAGGTVSTWTTGWITDLGEPAIPVGPGLLDISPDGRTVVAWGMGRGVRFLDATSMSELGSLEIDSDRSIVGVDFDPSGTRLVTATCPSVDKPSCRAAFEVWDARTFDRIAGPVEVGSVWSGTVAAVAFTGDGEQIVSAGFDGRVRRWDAASFEEFRPPLPHIANVLSLPANQVRGVFTTFVDGRSVLVAQGDRRASSATRTPSEAAVWDLTGEPRSVGALSGGLTDVGIGPDGHLVTAQGRGTLRFHDAVTLESVGEPVTSDVPSSWFRAFGTTLVSSGDSGTQVWDVAERTNLTGTIPSVTAVLSPDGQAIHLGGMGRGGATGDVIRTLPLDTAWLVEEACRRAGRNLTGHEAATYLSVGPERHATCAQWPLP